MITSAALAQIVVILVAAVVLLAGCVMWGITTSYRKASAAVRQSIATATVYHYVRTEHLVAHGNVVTVAARRGLYVSGIGPPRQATAAYFYVGRNGRGGWLNHGRPRDIPYSLIEISGADFLTWLGDAALFYRAWDRAILVRGTYDGPGKVGPVLHPREDRRLTS